TLCLTFFVHVELRIRIRTFQQLLEQHALQTWQTIQDGQEYEENQDNDNSSSVEGIVDSQSDYEAHEYEGVANINSNYGELQENEDVGSIISSGDVSIVNSETGHKDHGYDGDESNISFGDKSDGSSNVSIANSERDHEDHGFEGDKSNSNNSDGVLVEYAQEVHEEVL
ncbi:hypothetical protein H4219_006299, partial [Mycoemilia scoparia]